jgi:hypothetical protein
MPFVRGPGGGILRGPNGGIAGNVNCCCNDDPPPTTCCGETIEVEYEVYDSSNTTLIFQGTYQWPLDGAWTTDPQTREGIGFFTATDGAYRLQQDGIPTAICDSPNMTVSALIGSYFNDVAYDTQNVLFTFTCDELGEWSPWTQTAGMTRYRIRLLP